MAAASSTTPADVTQERSWLIERKKTSDGCDVWVSSMSANQSLPLVPDLVEGVQPVERWWRRIICTGEGGSPARVASRATRSSRRWNDA